MLKMTANRKLILRLLAEWSDDSPPPHSAGMLIYCLENMVRYQWQGYDVPKSVPRKEQVYRTLRDLVAAGLVVVAKTLEEPIESGFLPYWEKKYQLVDEVGRNAIMAECKALYRKVKVAKHGSNLFGAVFDKGLPADEVKPLMTQVKALMQKTHPDKVAGLEEEFKQMQECAKWIRSGIPLPTPTHRAGEKVALRLTKP